MRCVKTSLVVLGAILTVACASVTPDTGPLGPGPQPRIALVLGGGGARGFAHVGVIRVLEQEKIPIDLVVGTSVGSLIGALYAHQANSFELEWAAFSMEKSDVFDYTILSAGMGPVLGDKLEAFVARQVRSSDIEQLKIPFVAVAVDLNRGVPIALERGPVARAVRASCAIPGVFQPVSHQGRLLVDGGVINNIPISVARSKGVDVVIAVDISENVTNFEIANLLDVTLQAVAIMFRESVDHHKRDADVLITPSVGSVRAFDFTEKKRLMQAGIDATQKALPQIRKTIEDWKKKQSR